jgi:hypothetical protein
MLDSSTELDNHDWQAVEGVAMDVVVWLRSLGLGKYETAFRENEIDETVLPSLTHETLKELGVAAVGHGLKLLDAIAALPADANDKTPAANAATTPSIRRGLSEDRAERRHAWREIRIPPDLAGCYRESSHWRFSASAPSACVA